MNRHPPADRRCQIYIGHPGPLRCHNEGTHWERWGGCGCKEEADIGCLAEYYSWECAGEHDIAEAAA